jgi:hypothetical protein
MSAVDGKGASMFRFIFLLVSLSLMPSAKACTCPSTLSTDQQVVDGMMQDAVMVFIGKVTAANLLRLNSAERSFQFVVHESFKGVKKNVVTVYSALRSADCGTTLALGKTYLVAAYGRENMPIIRSCDRPEEIEFVAQRIALLRAK